MDSKEDNFIYDRWDDVGTSICSRRYEKPTAIFIVDVPIPEEIADFNHLHQTCDEHVRLANDFIVPKKRNQGIIDDLQGIRQRRLDAPSDVYGVLHNTKYYVFCIVRF